MMFDDGLPKIVPLRVATDFFLATEDPDPRGMRWSAPITRSPARSSMPGSTAPRCVVRYLEVELVRRRSAPVLVPMTLVRIHDRKRR